MKKLYCLLILLFITVSVFAQGAGIYGDKILSFGKANRETRERADSIMRLVTAKAIQYQHIISNYEAEIYIKGRTEILKQNILIRLAHNIFPINRKNKDMIFEMVSHSKYDAPNNYLHDLEAVHGNSIPNSQKQQEALAFLNLNVYSPTAYNEAIFMPIADNAFKYYTFNLESLEETQGITIYKIRFLPKQWSQKLLCGDLYIVGQSWTIDKIDMIGHYSFAEFNLQMSYNRNYRRFLLPEKADLSLRYKILGNVVVTNYHSSFAYKEVEWLEEDNESHERESLDLTNYYRLSSDTVPIIRDSAYWSTKRDQPLTQEESTLYNTVQEGNVSKIDTASDLRRYVKLTQQLTNTINLDYKTTRIKYSGILNPFQLGYSGRNGITYKQRIRASKTFAKDRQLRFHPEIGYVFKRKQIFFKVGGEWEYSPQRKGALSLEVGNSNESYSSVIAKKINEQLKDSAFNFDNLDLEYFKHYYVELKNSIELFNGFLLSTGVSYHRRIPSKKQMPINPGDEVEEILNQNFHDFTPVIGISYTPRQYYRMDGYRKEYIYSHYPTMSIQVARGIPGVGKSTGDYCRIEADVHQSLTLGLSRKLNYHVSGGLYTQQKSTYFADFRYFARRNFPDTWDDQIGGVFNLLEGEWFNASDKYLQAHFMYESPFVLFKILRVKSTKKFMQTASRYVFSERFYVSQLWTPVLPSYTEVGYGIGNHIFNIGIFAGFERLNYQGISLKFAFDLFQ